MFIRTGNWNVFYNPNTIIKYEKTSEWYILTFMWWTTETILESDDRLYPSLRDWVKSVTKSDELT